MLTAMNGIVRRNWLIRRQQTHAFRNNLDQPFRYFKTSPEVIRLAVMMYVRFPLSLRNVEDLLHERGINISHKVVQFCWTGWLAFLSLYKIKTGST